MRRSKAAVAAAFTTVALLSIAASPVVAASPNAAAKAKAEHQRIVSYWTAERIAGATSRDFVRSADGSFKLAKQKPEKGKPGGGGSATVLGALVDRRRIHPQDVGQGPVHDEQRRLHLHRDRGPGLGQRSIDRGLRRPLRL